MSDDNSFPFWDDDEADTPTHEQLSASDEHGDATPASRRPRRFGLHRAGRRHGGERIAADADESPRRGEGTDVLDADERSAFAQASTQTQAAVSGDAAVAEELEPETIGQPVADGAPDAGTPGAAARGSASDQSLARSSAIMAFGSIVSRVLGLVRQSLLTAVIGGLAVADAFQVANTLPNYVYMLLSAGILNAILIPQITKAMKRDDGGKEFIDRIVSISLALVVGVAIIATILSPWLVRLTSSLGGATYNLAVLFAYVCVPQIAFYGIYAVLGQVLNARNQFAAFMWAPVLANVVQIAGLVWFLVMWGHQGGVERWSHSMVWVLAGSTTLGIAVQGLFLVIPLVRGGFRLTPRFRGLRGSGLGSASRMAGWSFLALLVSVVGGGFAVSHILTHITDQPHSQHVVGYAGQTYAFLIFMIPHSFITTSVLTALFPRMTRAVHDDDAQGMRRLVRQGLSMPATAIIPASVALAILAIPVVRAMYAVSPHEGVVIGEALALMAIGTLPFGITTLQQRYCFAREDGWLNLWMQLIVTGGQVLFLLIALVMPATQALLWTAAGQTVGNSVAALLWLFIASRQLGGYGLRSVVRLWVRLAVASLFAGVFAGFATWGISHLLTTRMEQVGVVLVGGLLFVGLFWLAAQLLRIDEVDDFVNPILRRIPGVGRRLASA